MHDLVSMPEADATDARIVDMWVNLHESASTRKAYALEAKRFSQFVGKPLRQVGFGDLIAFRDSLGGSPASKRRAMAAVKSLLGFGHRIGALTFDVGRAVKAPKAPSRLAQRIMTAEDAKAIIGAAHGRDAALLALLYVAGVRVSELVSLTWRDLPAPGIVTVQNGKGGKSRVVRIPESVWRSIVALRGDASDDGFVFAGRHGAMMDTSNVLLLVRKYARAAGVAGNVSPHWFRHAHASHALDLGSTLAEVRDTLGHASVATTSAYLHARPDRSSGLRLLL
jgi:integrase/recombinase XerD